MTIHPVAPPHLLTVAEYLEIGEVEPGYTELVEGNVLMSPSPIFDHNDALFELALQIRSQLPAHLRLVLDLDVDLQLAPPSGPGTVRRPDLIVVDRAGPARVRREGGIIRAADVVLVAEIVSRGSRRTDHMVKRGEYADAGIPYYWIIDLGEPISLLACHSVDEAGSAGGPGEFGYADGGVVTGRYVTTEPFPVEIDLSALR